MLKCWSGYSDTVIVIKEGILPVEMKTFVNDIDIIYEVIYTFKKRIGKKGYFKIVLIYILLTLVSK